MLSELPLVFQASERLGKKNKHLFKFNVWQERSSLFSRNNLFFFLSLSSKHLYFFEVPIVIVCFTLTGLIIKQVPSQVSQQHSAFFISLWCLFIRYSGAFSQAIKGHIWLIQSNTFCLGLTSEKSIFIIMDQSPQKGTLLALKDIRRLGIIPKWC